VGFGNLEINGFWIIWRLVGFGRSVEVCRLPKFQQILFEGSQIASIPFEGFFVCFFFWKL